MGLVNSAPFPTAATKPTPKPPKTPKAAPVVEPEVVEETDKVE
jgi:hypothetical protein